MGLLDDAIREHLELKRLGGADPSEVIREEREALGPVVGGEDAASAGHDPTYHGSPIAGEDGKTERREASDSNGSHLSQETVELDMRALLEGEWVEQTGRAMSDALPPTMSAAPSRAGVEQSAPERGSPEDLLEWEVPLKRGHDFGGRLRAEETIRRTRIIDAQETPTADALGGIPASLLDLHGQERLLLDREAAHDFELDR
jgi:hypothetical protein